MLVDTEKNQDFLALAWSLQNNDSNAALFPKNKMKEIFDKKVCRTHYIDKGWVYGLEAIAEMQGDTLDSMPKERNKGGRPLVLTGQDKRNVLEWRKMGVSKRQIARKIGVSEWVVRSFLKGEKT